MNISLLIPLILFSLITFYRTRWGIYLILVLLPSFLIRTQVWFVPTTFLELAIYILAIIWIVKFQKNKKTTAGAGQAKKQKNNQLQQVTISYNKLLKIIRPFLIPTVLLIAATIISTLISPDKRLSLGILKGWFFDPLLFTIIFIDQIKTSKHINNVVTSLGLMTFCVSSYGIYEYFTSPQNLIEKLRLDSIFTSANYVTMLIVPITILILGNVILNLKQLKLKSIFSYFHIFIFLISLTAIYLTRSFSGWFGLGAGLLALGLFYPTKWKRKLMTILILIACFSTFLYTQKDNPKFKALTDFKGRTAIHTRLQIWQVSLAIIKDNPILGIGLGNFHESYLAYLLLTVPNPLEYDVLKPHNLYLNLWLETGILGLIAFVWLIVIFYKQKGSKALQLYGSTAGMAALLAQGLFDTPYFKNDLSILFWVLIGLVITNKKLVRDSAPAPLRT